MKRTFKKSLAWVLAVVMMVGVGIVFPISVSATQSVSSGFNTGYTLTGDGFTDMVNIAMAQNERTQAQIGYSESWCADFVSDCARLAGQESAIPFNGVVQSMYNAVINAGGYQISSPQAGDLVFFYNSGSGYGHVGIALDDSRNISGNIWYNGQAPSKVMILQNRYEGYGNWVFVRPNYTTSKPTDSEAPTISDVKVVDVSGESFTIQCELNDNVGVTRVWLVIYSPNGEKQFGVVASNGTFSYTVNTSEYGGVGNYAFHIYAFDAAENSAKGIVENIYASEKPTDSEAPTISDVTVSQVTAKGYRVTCRVSDNVGVTSVRFPTWGGGDFKWIDGIIEGNVATCYINTSEFNGEIGEYANHIYAYDAAGNTSSTSAGSIYVSDNPIEISSFIYNGHRYTLYNSGKMWTEAEQWCEQNGGYLATATSETEWNQISWLLKKYNGIRCWLGAESLSGAWRWVTGEAFDYSVWDIGQPDHTGTTECYLGTYGGGYLDNYKWNDFPYSHFCVGGFVFEKEITPTSTGTLNGHTYEYYSEPMDWWSAYRFCEKKGGHLVTINSEEENVFLSDFVYGTIEPGWANILTGGKLRNAGTWFWITGEPFDYVNWSPDEPDINSDDDSINMIISSSSTYAGKWNTNSSQNVGTIFGFVCEYEDVDASNYSPAYTEVYNGHVYSFFEDVVDWQTAKKICEAKGGYLVIIDNAEENSMVNAGMKKTSRESMWIGITDIAEEGVWRDVKGNLLQYTNWHPAQPDNYYGREDYGMMYPEGNWNDANSVDGVNSNLGFVCEFEFLCAGLGHDYQLTNHTDATCTTDGENIYTCSRCGDVKTEIIQATGHSYTAEVVEPTCTEQGYTVHTCTKCGDTYQDSYTDALGHQYQEEVIASTETEQGYTLHTCTRCGDSYKDHYTEKLLGNASTISATAVESGKSVQITAKASGGSGYYQYAVYYKKSTSKSWTTLQDFGTNTKVTFKPAKKADYLVLVKVKDSTGAIVGKTFTVSVNAPLKSASTVDKAEIALRESVTLKGAATGGVGAYQYAYYYKKTSEESWKTLKTFSDKAQVSFKPTEAGTYDICIKVKDGNKTTVKSYFQLTVSVPENTSKLYPSKIAAGKTAKVYCSATGGTGFYQYAVYYKPKESDKWTKVQAYDANTTVTFKPPKAGTYDVSVMVKDSAGNVVKKYFTLTVT